MEVRSLRLPKKTGTYADSLAVAGLERLLDLLGAGHSRIEDRGGFYGLILESPVQLEDLDYESIRSSPGYPYVKLKNNSPEPLGHIDYQAERERLLNYRELRNSLMKKGSLTERDREQLRQAEPRPRWYLYQNVNVLKGFGPYNKLYEKMEASSPEEFAQALREKLSMLATNGEGGSNGRAFDPKVTAVQVFTPAVGKGLNAVKTSLSAASSLPNNFVDWFDEYLKYLGLSTVANARAVGDDIKLFVISPGNLNAGALGRLSDEFFRLRLPWSSAQIDIQGALGLAKILVRQLTRDELDEYEETTPRTFVSGLQTAYFKSLGSARALANVGFIGLPGWFPVTSENSEDWLEILEEHMEALRVLNEERSEEAELLFLYRDFLSADKGQALNVQALLEFLSSYAPFLIRARERKRYVRQFTTSNLRRLLVSLNRKFRKIVEDPGFRAVAGAIRRSTVTEQYHKSKDQQVFEIEYGLFQDFKRKAHFPDQFVQALSVFVNSYNAQNARREEQLKGKGGRRRAHLTVGDLDSVVELIDTHGSEPVAMLLIAYGSARDPRAPDEAAEIAALEEKQEA
jgi:hypothetical protein